jgi:hypothetical protein
MVLILIFFILRNFLKKNSQLDPRMNQDNYWMLSYDFKALKKYDSVHKASRFRNNVIFIYYMTTVAILVILCAVFAISIDLILNF